MAIADIDSRCYGHEPAASELRQLREDQAALDWVINNVLTQDQLKRRVPWHMHPLSQRAYISNRRGQ